MFCKKYISNESGNLSLMAALVAGCMLLAVGAAIETTSMTKVKSKLQDAADNAVMAATVSGEENNGELTKIATEVAEMNYDGEIDVTFERDRDSLFVSVTAQHDMLFMGMFGYQRTPITVNSGSQRSSGGKINIALALDTTSSMAGVRMTAMIEAATDLVNEVDRADKGQGNAKISLVPFADYVRIDPAYSGASWLDVPPDRNVTWDVLDDVNSTNCRQVGTGERATTECDAYVYITYNETFSWSGCMGSRPDGRHTTAAFAGERYKGVVGNQWCDDAYNFMVPLTDDFEQLETEIAGLVPDGMTYIPSGLIWAWRNLEEAELFSSDNTKDEDAQNVIILMTDGSNTQRMIGTVPGWDGIFHWGTSDAKADQEAADDLTLELCKSIKASDIRIITVAYEVDDADTKTMLKACASSGGDFYDAKNASKLKQAFGKIGSSFDVVRLTL